MSSDSARKVESCVGISLKRRDCVDLRQMMRTGAVGTYILSQCDFARAVGRRHGQRGMIVV